MSVFDPDEEEFFWEKEVVYCPVAEAKRRAAMTDEERAEDTKRGREVSRKFWEESGIFDLPERQLNGRRPVVWFGRKSPVSRIEFSPPSAPPTRPNLRIPLEAFVEPDPLERADWVFACVSIGMHPRDAAEIFGDTMEELVRRRDQGSSSFVIYVRASFAVFWGIVESLKRLLPFWPKGVA